MILTLDVGNTQITGGLWDEDKLVLTFRRTTAVGNSSDEIGIFMRSVIRENGFHFTQLIFCHIGSSFALLSVDKCILLQVDRNVKVNFLKVRGHPAVAVVRIRESIRCSKEPLNKLSSA